MKKKGFTVIELLVVGAIGVILMAIVMYVLTSSAKMASKSRLNRIIDDQGAWLMYELKKNIMWARPGSVTCPSNSVSLYNRADNQGTVISLSGTRIASTSANTVNLTSDEVSVSSWTVSCALTGSNQVVSANFTLRAGNTASNKPEDSTSKSFQTTITVRP